MEHPVVSREAWLEARKQLLQEEKAFTRARDAMMQRIRSLPWVQVEKVYRFQGPDGELSLADLFGGHSQLAVYHFMLGPDWEEGCKSCSFWADSFDGAHLHLPARDVAFVAVSRAPLERIEAFRARMGWSFPWVSSHGSDFNHDFGVAFTEAEREAGTAFYNYRQTGGVADEMPGASFFYRDGNAVFHTYSTYGRGLDLLNAAYNWLDLAPLGRNEGDQPYTMAWVRHHDKY